MQPDADLLHYFDPVDLKEIQTDDRILQPLLSKTHIYRPKSRNFRFRDADVVLVGIGRKGSADDIRRHLYGLSFHLGEVKMADLGNLRPGKTPEDTFIGITDVVAGLGKMKKKVILIGDSTRQVLPVFHGVQQLEHPVNLTVADSRIDLMPDDHYLLSHYLNPIVSDPETLLFDFVHLGYQSYLCNPSAPELLDQLWFDHYRLGNLREDLRETEPVFRNTDLFACSMSSVRQPEAPGVGFPSPNGFTAEEICQISRYAGLSDKLSVFALLDYVAEHDHLGQTAALAAQVIWHFLQGFTQRRNDYPFTDIREYQKYIVTLPKAGHDLCFYKSPASNRWWMEVPYPDTQYPRSLYVACSPRDYQVACDGEIPDRWWKNYQRLL